jgi:hypothetical protein
MLKNLLVAFGLVIGLGSLSGCNLYIEDDSSAPSPGRPGSPGTPGVPGTPTPPGYECAADGECAAGCYCGPDGTCVEGGFCTDDGDCGDGMTCDEKRNSCDPQGAGTCGGEVTCNEVRPNCPADSVPLVEDGCWTGACLELALCDVSPSCERLNTESSCLARTECGADYSATCTNPSGGGCSEGDPGCVCRNYRFDECFTK